MIINTKNTVSARAEITVAECTRAGAGWGRGRCSSCERKTKFSSSREEVVLLPISSHWQGDVGPLGKEVTPSYPSTLPEGQIWSSFPPVGAQPIHLW